MSCHCEEQWEAHAAGSSTWPGRVGSHRKPVGVGRDRGCAAPARACVRGGQRGGKGRDDGGWTRRGPRGGGRGEEAMGMGPHAPRRTLPPPFVLYVLRTCCAVVRRSSAPTASGEDARILCGGGFAASRGPPAPNAFATTARLFCFASFSRSAKPPADA